MIKEGGRLARRNGEAGRDGGETPPLQMHAEAPPPVGRAPRQTPTRPEPERGRPAWLAATMCG